MPGMFTIKWREPTTGKRDKVKTPLVPNDGVALCWFLKQRPYMIRHLEDLSIKLTQKGEK